MKNRLLVAATLVLFSLLCASTTLSQDDGTGVILAVGDVARCKSSWKDRVTEWLEVIPGWKTISVAVGWQRNEPVPLSDAKHTAQLLNRLPGVILGLGDLAYRKGTLSEYETCFGKIWSSIISRVHPVPGNHDYKTGAVGYRAYFGARAGGPLNFYGFDFAGWHLIALNSEIDAASGSLQARWVTSDLAANVGKCSLAFFHRPAYSSKQREGKQFARQLFKLLYDWRVTLILNGHDHLYERIMPLDGWGAIDFNRGIRQFVVGTGGGDFHERPTVGVFSEQLITHQYGVLRLSLMPSSYEWQFLAAPSGKVLDRGRSWCRPIQPLVH